MILYSADNRQMERKSSIEQFDHFLSVYKQGGQVPISYDVIESITCDGIKSHKAIMNAGRDYKGFVYPIAHCSKEKIQYLLTDQRGVIEKELPECQGKGTYQQYVDRQLLTNADNEALGVSNRVTYRVGLDFYTCINDLPAVE